MKRDGKQNFMKMDLKVIICRSVRLALASTGLKLSELNNYNATQGRNRRKNLDATSAMVGRICPPWWG